MNVSELALLSRQMGNKIIEARDGKLYGYTITGYRGYTPTTIELVGSIDNPAHRVMSWDTAYDLIFGAPTAPNFNSNLIGIK